MVSMACWSSPRQRYSGAQPRASGSELDGQGLQPAQRRGLPPLQLRVGQAQTRHALEQRAQRELTLHAGQRGSEAEVNAEPEGDVAVVGACDVEPVRIREVGRIPVGRS